MSTKIKAGDKYQSFLEADLIDGIDIIETSELEGFFEVLEILDQEKIVQRDDHAAVVEPEDNEIFL